MSQPCCGRCKTCRHEWEALDNEIISLRKRISDATSPEAVGRALRGYLKARHDYISNPRLINDSPDRSFMQAAITAALSEGPR